MKKIFNLAVVMSVIASSLFFASCGDDDEGSEIAPNKDLVEKNKEKDKNQDNHNHDQDQEQNGENQDQNGDEQTEEEQKIEGVTSFIAAKGDEYLVYNSKLNVSGAPLSITAVSETRVSVSYNNADTTVTIGSGSGEKAYVILLADNIKIQAVSKASAETKAAKVLFICKSNSEIASPTLAGSEIINTQAGETTFVKK